MVLKYSELQHFNRGLMLQECRYMLLADIACKASHYTAMQAGNKAWRCSYTVSRLRRGAPAVQVFASTVPLEVLFLQPDLAQPFSQRSVVGRQLLYEQLYGVPRFGAFR